MFRAPHKPLLLLSVIDRFAEKSFQANFIELDSDLIELFAIYWAKVTVPGKRGNISMPFWHLQSDGFWHLLPREGKQNIVELSSKIHSIGGLREVTFGAKVDDELYELIKTEQSRNILRTVLIQTYFSADIQPKLIEQGTINLQSFLYSQQLLQKAKRAEIINDAAVEIDKYKTESRDQGFRRAIVSIYEYRCAFCGIRILTPEGHSVIDAAHIIPWSISHNDDPRNGMALCKLCHWAFDEGLMTVTPQFSVKTSQQLNTNHNLPSHLTALNGRHIIAPDDQLYWPHLDCLNWHYQNRYIRR